MKHFRQSRIKDNLWKRARIVQAIRSFFISNNYLEVETPVRIPAPAPEIHIDAIKTDDWFLQTSPELCMKRLLSSGYPKIFQICKCFREKERGAKHLPELSMLEWYSQGKNYVDLMSECEELINHIAGELGIKEGLFYQGEKINIHPPFEKISVKDAFRKYAGADVKKAIENRKFNEIMGLQIEPKLGHGLPTFLYDYPAEEGALAKLKPSDPSVAERFELYVSGLELCNAFSELTDAHEQRLRFEKEIESRTLLNKVIYPMPEPFLSSLENMPESAGIAFGIDRLVMLFTDSIEIDDVSAFVPEEI